MGYRFTLAFLLCSFVFSPLFAGDNEHSSAAQRAEAELTIAGVVVQSPAAMKPGDKDTPKPIKDVLPDAKKIEGMIPLYRKKDKLYAEITGGNLNTDYLIAMAIAKGSGTAAIGGYTLGFGDDWLWQFRKVNDRIQVVRRNIRFKADSGTPEAKAVEIAYSDSILYSLPIVARGESGGDVIDLDAIFMSDLARVGSMSGSSFARDRSVWGDVKGFNNNVELRVNATYTSYGRSMLGYDFGYRNTAAPDGANFGVTIHYSISKLPSSGYTPRLADDRIGYFTTSHKNYSKNQKDEHFIRYINRWNLQKADPGAALSPPKKPIVFWIEKTVPFKYRGAVREGILEWNKAFEKAGILNAIEVRQQSDTDTWDPEDINYNTFRWITADAGFAMGPSHVNPLTGEILDADIIMDAGWVDHWKQSFDMFLADTIPPISREKSKIENLRDLLYQHKPTSASQEHEHSENHDAMNHCTCNYTRSRACEMAFASLAVALMEDEKAAEEKKEEPKKEDAEEKKEEKKEGETANAENKDGEKKEETPEKTEGEKKEEPKKEEEKKPSKAELKKKAEEAFEKFVLEGIKDVVSHEVGHTLGLRHNFKASSWLSLEEINNPERSKEFGFAGSVMDYLPINISPKGKPQGDYFMKTIGPYDYLAIEYGYKPFGGGTDGEKKDLSKIAARQSEKGMHFATDEDMLYYGPDPLTGLRDLGADPIDYAKSNAELYRQLLPEILERAVEEGDNYREVPYYYLSILSRLVSSNSFLARNIGGYYINRDHKGDPEGRAPIQLVDAKKQRETLEYLCKEVFSSEGYTIPPELYNHFGSEQWIDWSGGYSMGQIEIRDTLLSAQLAPLRAMVNSSTLSRIDDNELRVKEGEDVFTIMELFDSLTAAIFRELDQLKEGDFTPQKPAIGLIRRNLQDYYFTLIADYTSGSSMSGGMVYYYYRLPESVHAVARQQLISLSTNIQSVLSGKAKLDPASKAHLQNLHERIQKVLNSQMILTSP